MKIDTTFGLLEDKYTKEDNEARTFKIHPNLLLRLKYSNIGDIPIEFFKLPFNCCDFILPRGIVDFSLSNGDYISKVELREDFIFGGIRVNFLGNNLCFPICFQRSYGETIELCLANSIKEEDLLFKEKLSLVNEEIDRRILAMRKEIYSKLDDRNIVDNKERIEEYLNKNRERLLSAVVRDEATKDLLFKMGRIVIQILMYINGYKADIVYADKLIVNKNYKSKSIPTSIKNAFVGYNIVIDRKERDIYEYIGSGDNALSKRFMVRGHNRLQPYGENNSLRKLIFIDPFWKGPELGEISIKDFDVK